jgi:hypothetical protein
VKTTGNQIYNDDVVLQQNTVLSSTANGNITFAKTVNADAGVNDRTLEVNTAGDTVFRRDVGGSGPLQKLTTDIPGQTILGDASDPNPTITVNALFQTYGDKVLLADNVVLRGSGVGGDFGAYNVQLGTVENATFGAPRDLTIKAQSGTLDSGEVHATSTDEAAAFASYTRIGQASDRIGNLTVVAAPLPTSGGGGGGGNPGPGPNPPNPGTPEIILRYDRLTPGAQRYRGAVVLANNIKLESSGAGNIAFDSTVNSDATARSLEVNTAGDEVFGGVVGGSSALAQLRTDAAGTVGGSARFNMDVNSAPAGKAGVNVNGKVTVNDSVMFNVANSTVGKPTVRTGGGQEYNVAAGTAATLNQNTILADNANQNVIFQKTVDGNRALTVNTKGDEVFNGVVGGNTALASLTTDDPTAPANEQTGGSARFNMDVNSAPAGKAGVNVNGKVTVNDSVVFNAANSTVGKPTVRTGGGQEYNVAAGTVATLNQDTILADNANQNITFQKTVDGNRALTANTGGDEVFNGLVGSETALASLTTDDSAAPAGERTSGLVGSVDAARFNMDVALAPAGKAGVNVNGKVTVNDSVAFNAANSSVAKPTVRTGGGQEYNVAADTAATLNQDTVLADSGNQNITFQKTVDAAASGVQGLTVNTRGDEVFNGAVGLGADKRPNTADDGILKHLTTDDPSAPANEQTGGSARLNGGAVNADSQTYNDNVTLGAVTTLGGSSVAMNGNVVGGGNDLTVKGNLELGDVVADTATGLGALIVNGNAGFNAGLVQGGSVFVSGATAMKSERIATTGNQTYRGVFTVGSGDKKLEARDLTFSGNVVNSPNVQLDVENLFLDASADPKTFTNPNNVIKKAAVTSPSWPVGDFAYDRPTDTTYFGGIGQFNLTDDTFRRLFSGWIPKLDTGDPKEAKPVPGERENLPQGYNLGSSQVPLGN